jgi:hypothetical protein
MDSGHARVVVKVRRGACAAGRDSILQRAPERPRKAAKRFKLDSKLRHFIPAMPVIRRRHDQ